MAGRSAGVLVNELAGVLINVVRDYAAPMGGVVDAAPAIQAAIEAARNAGGGVVWLPPGKFLLASSLVLRNGVSVVGAGSVVRPDNASSWDLGFTVVGGSILTFPGGTIFTQDTSGGVGTAGAVSGARVQDVGFDTCGSIITSGATSTTGLSGSVLRNLWGSNISGVAFDLSNPMHVNGSNLKCSYVNQLLRITSDYDTAVVNHQPGNSRFDDLYAYVTAAGHPNPTVHLRCLTPGATGTALNYIHVTRLQVNRFASVANTGQHLYLQGAGVGVPVNACTFDGLDLEGYAQYRMRLERSYKNRLKFSGSCLAGNATADLYVRNSLYNMVENQDVNLVLDMDDTASPLLWFGHLKSVLSNRYPLGHWWDSTKAGGAQLGMERLAPWDNSTFGRTLMPQTDLDFNSGGGGGIRDKETDIAGAAVTIAASTMGFHKGVYGAGASTVTLPDATLVPRRTCKFIQTTAQTMTIQTQLSQTINGAASIALTQWQAATLQSDGANWFRLS